MTRHNHDNFKETPSASTTSINNTIIDLPDLSAFRPDEKKHILNVLERDENLRNKHLSRFMNLRKEVADLEKESKKVSTSVCARCQTPFGFIFNTGDICPKCGAKVCKQCRLMYNVNDNGWLCQLCCKQMQLMSYSGEWLYSNRHNLEKLSTNPQDAQYGSLSHLFSARDSHMESSSDSEPEEIIQSMTGASRFIIPALPAKIDKQGLTESEIKTDKMIRQSEIDEQKLKFIKEHIKKRPVNVTFTQPLPRRTQQLTLPSPTSRYDSSDETNSMVNQSNNRQKEASKKQNSSLMKDIAVFKPKLNDSQNIDSQHIEMDRSSIASDMTNNETKSKRQRLKEKLFHHPLNQIPRQQSTESPKTSKLSSKHLSASMQNIRDTVRNVSPGNFLSSRTSLNSEKKAKVRQSSTSTVNEDDTVSLKVPDKQSRSSITMTDLYHHEQQQTNLSEHTPVLTSSTMPSFYPPTRHRPFISKHISDHDDDDSDSIYNQAFIVQVFQHWKIKTLEHQQALHNAANMSTNNTAPNHFSQASIKTLPPVETPKNEGINDEILSNDVVNAVNESQKPIITMKKRDIPLVTTQTRRASHLKQSMSVPPDTSNPNLLAPHTKTKFGTTTTTTATTTTTISPKKTNKPAPIFIAPRKTQPPSLPRSYSCLSLDESSQNKRRGMFDKQSAYGDDQNSMTMSSFWAPPRSLTPSPSSPIDDDETSGDENNHESLLIRNKKFFKKTTKTKEKHYLSIPSNLNIPTAICITDPHGHSRVFDINNDWHEEFSNNERIVENEFTSTNTFDPNSLFDYSSPSSSIVVIPPSPPTSPDKYALHSIGEEEEEYAFEKENNDGIILSKELNRIEAYSRSRQTNSNVQKQKTVDQKQNQNQNGKPLLERRWSDSFVNDDENHIGIQQSPLVKMASVASIAKPSVTPPVKLSKTKYLLIKLHLASLPNKEEDLNYSPPPPPTTTAAPSSSHIPTKYEASQPHINESKESLEDNQEELSETVIQTQSKQEPSAITQNKTTIKTIITTISDEENHGNTRTSRTPTIENRVDTHVVRKPSDESRVTTRTDRIPTIETRANTRPDRSPSVEKRVTTDTNRSLSVETRTTTHTGRTPTVETRTNIRTGRTASVGNRATNADSDEDIDNTFKQAKLGSQLSINSAISDTKSQFDIEITGSITLKLTYDTTKNLLNVLIHKCTNLAPAKRNQTSNPYCKTYLLPDESKTSKLKTSVKKHTTDPAFGETLHYQVSARDFNSRILWVSVWNRSTLKHNDFLGEIHIPLANCTLDKVGEYTLLPRVQKDDAASINESIAETGELQFELTFIENDKNKELGTIQVNAIQGKGIYYGKNNVDAICKGLLMPDKTKRKLPTVRRGPFPKWDVPLRWESIRRSNLRNMSIEISIWCQERFRKNMIGSIKLNSSQGQIDDKPVKWLEATKAEKTAWELFLKDPTKIHHCRLPLRPATNDK
ncbi:unnamed protein product [Adineta steineri]|uniref:Uncharacterized protein n=1 Tax=Adineta steineri TaxID=433720 RepID=A0A814R6S9_9BILA|nr:unnamed protein product [Adineta steineri]CAF1278902.1 unnamed protein product [Adineta steineri]